MQDSAAFFKDPNRLKHGTIAVLSILIYCASAWGVHSYRLSHMLYAEVAIMFWVIAPPLYFLAEFWLVGRRARDDSKKLPSVEAFKYSQDLAAKFWLAGLAVLVFLYRGTLQG